MGYSGVDEENRSRKIFPALCGTLLIASLIGCSLFSWFILQDPYKPLPEYPYAKNIQSRYTEDVSCCTETITTFETVDSPAEVYEFYRRAFRFRLKWRPRSSATGLSYSLFLGCPVGSYSITAVQLGDRTEVTIRLSTHICI